MKGLSVASDTMSHEEMAQVIQNGGSVLHKGVLYTRVDALPSEADLSVESNDEDQIQAQIDKLLDQQAKHKAQIASLKAAQQAATETAAQAQQAAADAQATAQAAVDAAPSGPSLAGPTH